MWELHNFESMVCATAKIDKEVELPWHLGDFHLFPFNELCYVSKCDILRIIISVKNLVSFVLLCLFAIVSHLFILILFKFELLLLWILLIVSLVGFFNALNSLSEVGQFCYMLCIISNNSFIRRRACSTSPSKHTSLKEEAPSTAL